MNKKSYYNGTASTSTSTVLTTSSSTSIADGRSSSTTTTANSKATCICRNLWPQGDEMLFANLTKANYR